MAVFIYKAKSLAGKTISGEIEGENQQAVLYLLKKQKLKVSNLRKKPKEIKIRIGKGVKNKEIAIFTRQLSTMISAGLPLIQCLEILSKQTEKEFFRNKILEIMHDVEGGSSLTDGLSKQKLIFGSLFIHMVEAGEAGGILDIIFLRLASYLEKADALKRKVRGAMMYPAVIAIVAMTATIFLLVGVIPTFAKMFQGFGATLPLPTRVVLAISDFIKYYFYLLIIGFTGSIVSLKLWYKTETGKYRIDLFKLKVPIFGKLIKKVAISRFTRTLGTLVSSGVPILSGLDITAKTAGNVIIEKAILNARTSISEGETISEPLQKAGVFPPMVIHMISVGEKTGELDEMLTKIADFYDDEVDAAVSGLTSILEPLLIVFMGLIIGGVVVAMYLPMFDLIKAVRGG